MCPKGNQTQQRGDREALGLFHGRTCHFLSFLVIFCQSQVPPLQPGNFSELPGDVKMFYSSPVSRLALAFLLVLI